MCKRPSFEDTEIKKEKIKQAIIGKRIKSLQICSELHSLSNDARVPDYVWVVDLTSMTFEDGTVVELGDGDTVIVNVKENDGDVHKA